MPDSLRVIPLALFIGLEVLHWNTTVTEMPSSRQLLNYWMCIHVTGLCAVIRKWCNKTNNTRKCSFSYCFWGGKEQLLNFAHNFLKVCRCGKESASQYRRHRRSRSDPWVGKIPGEENGSPLQYSCWKITWTGEPGGLQSVESQRVGHNWATAHTHTCMCINT